MWDARLTHFAGEYFFFQSRFEANEMFCLRMKSVLLTNQKQPLKFVQQNSYLDLLPNTLHIIIQRVHLLIKLQAGRTNKQTANMKSLTGISQGFDKCTKATLQNNYFYRTPPDDSFCFETWSRYHYDEKRLKV